MQILVDEKSVRHHAYTQESLPLSIARLPDCKSDRSKSKVVAVVSSIDTDTTVLPSIVTS